MQLAELRLQSWRERRWIDVPPLARPSPGQRKCLSAHKRPAHCHAGTASLAAVRDCSARDRVAAAARASREWNRVAFAAAHVVADPRADVDPWLAAAIDWDATLAYRRHLWSLGFGVAEAMDTAQRGMGLDWPTSLELIRRSVAEARAHAGRRRVLAARAPITSRPIRTLTLDARDRGLRRAMRGGRGRGRPHHPDGEPRARRVRAIARRLCRRLRSRARAGARAGDPALAGRDVRPGARRLLGGAGGLASDPEHARATDVCAAVIARERRQGRRHQGLAARRRQGNRAAPPPARRRAHVHRRRLQLRGR